MNDNQDLQNYINRLEIQVQKMYQLLKKINVLARYCLKDKTEKRKENLLQIIKWTN